MKQETIDKMKEKLEELEWFYNTEFYIQEKELNCQFQSLRDKWKKARGQIRLFKEILEDVKTANVECDNYGK